jgi:metallo-beta-lactamase family protein
MKIQFLGAVRQVTGSQHYLEADGVRLLVDCGLFQEREFQSRNWEPSPIRARDLSALLLTHAHLDHCGLTPKLVREGFRGPIHTTAASGDLVEIVLRDSAEIQAEDAAFKQKRHRKEGRQGPFPAQPLYTMKDVDRTIPLLDRVAYNAPVAIGDKVSATFHDAGHILGSAMIELNVASNGTPRKVLFSGDIGQWDRPLMRDPSTFTEADYVVMEATYGDREHPDHGSVEEQLGKVIQSTFEMGGKLIVPVFAIERAQEMLYYLGRLLRAKQIPECTVFLDSPMAADVVEVFRRHRDCFDDAALEIIENGHSPLGFPGLRTIRTAETSKAINKLRGPAIILATSGMCTAGRIKHHLAHHISNPADTVLFVGYQARGTLGRQIVEGNPEVRIHGRKLLVRARVLQIFGFSGHADRTALMRWLGHFQKPPRQLFICHGDEPAALSFAEHVRETLGWNVHVPKYQEAVELD